MSRYKCFPDQISFPEAILEHMILWFWTIATMWKRMVYNSSYNEIMPSMLITYQNSTSNPTCSSSWRKLISISRLSATSVHKLEVAATTSLQNDTHRLHHKLQHSLATHPLLSKAMCELPHHYWISHAIWNHTVFSCHLAAVIFPPLPQPKCWLSIQGPERDARLSWLVWWLYRKIVYPKTVTYLRNYRTVYWAVSCLGIKPAAVH